MTSGPSAFFPDSPGAEDICLSSGSSLSGNSLEGRGLLVGGSPGLGGAGFSWPTAFKQTSKSVQNSRKATCKADFKSRIVGPHRGGFAVLPGYRTCWKPAATTVLGTTPELENIDQTTERTGKDNLDSKRRKATGNTVETEPGKPLHWGCGKDLSLTLVHSPCQLLQATFTWGKGCL